MLTQLRYFIAIIDHGGMTAAANALGVSQPALTRSLQALEQQLDARLVDRGAGAMVPTPAGILLLRRARILLAEQRSMIDDLASLIVDEHSVTRINGAPMTAVTLLPAILSRMALDYPQCRVSVRGDCGANYAWKLNALLTGEIDVALTLYDPAIQHEELVQELLFEPELRVVVSRRHRAIQNRAASLADLIDNRWILPPEGSSPRAVVENEFRMHGLPPPRDSIEISDWRIALGLLEQSDYVTAIPYHPACFADQFERFHILPIHFSVRPIAISIVTRAPAVNREGTRAVVETARALVREVSI